MRSNVAPLRRAFMTARREWEDRARQPGLAGPHTADTTAASAAAPVPAGRCSDRSPGDRARRLVAWSPGPTGRGSTRTDHRSRRDLAPAEGAETELCIKRVRAIVKRAAVACGAPALPQPGPITPWVVVRDPVAGYRLDFSPFPGHAISPTLHRFSGRLRDTTGIPVGFCVLSCS